MQIRSIDDFLPYLQRIRFRTMRLADCIPPDRLEWRPQPGRFSCGDLLRHIATIERYLYAETIAGRPSRYAGCSTELANGLPQTINFVNRLHQESIDIFQQLSPEQLNNKCLTPTGHTITTWKWLRAMVEHEIHHRGQLYLYLGLMDIPTPPVFGLTSEEVRELSKK